MNYADIFQSYYRNARENFSCYATRNDRHFPLGIIQLLHLALTASTGDGRSILSIGRIFFPNLGVYVVQWANPLLRKTRDGTSAAHNCIPGCQ